MQKELCSGAHIAVVDCMAVKPGETVLIVADELTQTIGKALWAEAVKAKAEVIYMEMIPRKNDGTEPPAAIAAAMLEADVVLAPTSRSISHTNARKCATEKGARVVTLPGITEDIVQRALNADYNKIAQLSKLFANLLNLGSDVHLTTAAGTDLTLSITGRTAYADTGINHKPGDFGNLPAGEAYIAPVEGTAQGKIVIDGAMCGIGVLENPITLVVKDGYVTEIQGGQEAERLEDMLSEYGQLGRNIAELGIGTNDKAILTGKVIEDEKVLGTVHLALGNNFGFGGKVQVPLHLDGIIRNPTLVIDGQTILKQGKSLI